jgi:hypothetical protein
MGLTQKLGAIPLAIQTDSSNNVGIGGAANASYKLAVTGASLFSGATAFGSSLTTPSVTDGGQYKLNFGGNAASRSWRLISDSYNFGDFSIQQSTTQTGSTYADRFIISANGNVGIGISVPLFKLDVIGGIRVNEDGAGTKVIQIRSDFAGVDPAINVSTNNALLLQTNNTERMRITSGGYVLMGTTGNSFNSRLVLYSDVSYTLHCVRTGTGSEGQVVFSNGNGAVGSIFTSGTSTSYNTSSDYRLKEDLKEIKGLEKVSAIKVYDFKWKADESRMDGVIAHELQEILPYAVVGEKDGEQMQGVDYSKLVPVLVKAIQELNAKVTALENK